MLKMQERFEKRTIENLPSYQSWHGSFMQGIDSLIERKFRSLSTNFAQDKDVESLSHRMGDVEGKCNGFAKKIVTIENELKKFDMDTLKQTFVTKVAPDNVLQRLKEVEIRTKGFDSLENRMSNAERDISTLKGQMINADSMEDILKRLGDLE